MLSQIKQLTEFPTKQYSTWNNIIIRPTIMLRKRNRRIPVSLITPTTIDKGRTFTRHIPITKLNRPMCALPLYKQHIMPTVNYNASKRNRTTHEEKITNLHGIRRRSNEPNCGNYPESFAVGLSKIRTGVECFENRLFKLIMHSPWNINKLMACQKFSYMTMK